MTMPDELKLVVVGAGGRMGRELVRAISRSQGVTLSGASEAPGCEHLGADASALAGLEASGVEITDDPLPLFAGADGVVDFTAPAATLSHAALAAQARIVHVIGTTGLSDEDEAAIAAAAMKPNRVVGCHPAPSAVSPGRLASPSRESKSCPRASAARSSFPVMSPIRSAAAKQVDTAMHPICTRDTGCPSS